MRYLLPVIFPPCNSPSRQTIHGVCRACKLFIQTHSSL
ncbi:hypothetical protein IPG36_03575 [bacterium]|nr:MAG: hypothetical protein IPG36_03575 [bacterium]